MAGKDHFGYLLADMRKNIKMAVKEMGYECMGWINLAKVRVQWRTLLNMVMNLSVV
jgi:hypothetical protein